MANQKKPKKAQPKRLGSRPQARTAKALKRKAKPAFLGLYGFPATLCTSVNEVVVHGIPSKEPLKEGDILSVDVGLIYQGFAADMARTLFS